MRRVYELGGVSYECTQAFTFGTDGDISQVDPSTVSDREMFQAIDSIIQTQKEEEKLGNIADS